ncbi:MAG TPA: cysteine desulfurase family protein [Kofleriaceae bacterium]
MSTKPRIYLDFNATAPLVSAARTAMLEALADAGGNPSSIHAEGRAARDRIERARDRVATRVGMPREHVIFTSGGTEANALGVATLAAAAEARGLPRICVTTRLEHPSLLGAVRALEGRGWSIEYAVAPPAVTPGLVAAAWVNHELGTLVAPDLVAWARANGALVHVDAVQANGKGAALDADAIAISAHKIGGPQGIGALVTAHEVAPLIDGGHQERGRRPGTENAVGIVGFGAAAHALDEAAWPAVAALGDHFEAGLLALGDVTIHGAGQRRIGGTINAGFAGARGESIVIALDLAGIAAATGSACTSGSVQPSPVLLGLGLSADAARSAVRFSLGRTTTRDELDHTLAVLAEILPRARKHG